MSEKCEDFRNNLERSKVVGDQILSSNESRGYSEPRRSTARDEMKLQRANTYCYMCLALFGGCRHICNVFSLSTLSVATLATTRTQ